MAMVKLLQLFRVCAVWKRPGSRLCDFKLSSGKSCDVPLCSSCTLSVGPNIDYCRSHPAPQNTLAFSP